MTYAIEKDWTTEVGLRAVVIMTIGRMTNHRCGYVAVTPEHPAYGKEYSEQLDAISQADVNETPIGKKSPILILTAMVRSDDEHNKIRRSIDVWLDVHGGVTYSSSKDKGTYPIDYENLWWFGFDTAHYGDDERNGGQPQDYCIAECEKMAAQLVTLKSPPVLQLTYQESGE